MSKYYELSTDYDLADKLLKEGQTLTMCTNGEFYIVKNSAGLGNCEELREYGSKFLLPVDLPNTTELQHSLTQALNEADELRDENAHQKELLEELRIAVNSDNKAKTIRFLQIQIKNYQAMLEGTNENDQALTSIAKRLGFDRFDDEQVAIAIEELQALKQQYKTIESRSISSNTILIETIQDFNNQIQTLEDNLTRSQSDRLSELTTIIRMIQALSDTPQDCYYGAIRLIHQVIYDQICKLDPTQSWDI